MNKMILFLDNFYTLLQSGYSVEETLGLCQLILKTSFIHDMEDRLKNGDNIYQILIQGPFPRVFKEYLAFYKNKNCLSEAIEKSLKIYKMQEEYKEKLKSQLTYPIILLLFLFLFSIFIVIILLPNVYALFDSFQIKKSLFIEIMFSIFHFFPIIFIGLSLCVFVMIFQLINGLRHKRFKTIEFYLRMNGMKIVLQKYFSLKFVMYYHELALEDIDSAHIIQILNEQMNESDIKIVLYELNNRILEGESIEGVLDDFEYLDPLFLTFFKMYIQNPTQQHSLQQYIDLTYQQLDQWITQFLKYMIPLIYGFVALFVISIYISIIIPMMNVISDI